MFQISIFTTKEYQNNVLGGTELGLLDYGARFYDPQIARWHVQDPLAEKYYSISPYAYCASNPVKYIDIDGRKIVIAGTNEFRKSTFNDMQKLSSNNLIMLKSGQVVEAFNYKGAKSSILYSGTASEGKKEFGTSMIHDLAGNLKHTITVKQGSEDSGTNEFLPTNGNYSNAQNPNKGSGGVLKYDPKSKGYGIVNKDETTGVDAYIILGHELIHADKAMKGRILDRENNIYDPASPSNWAQKISKEEADTRRKENILRKENGIEKTRLTPSL